MKRLQEQRMGILAGMAVFILGVFVWGAVSWQQTLPFVTESQEKKTDQEKPAPPKQTASGKSIDIEKLKNQLLQDIKYETKLEALDDSVVAGMVSLQKESKSSLYMGEGTCSDEVLVVTASSEDAAKKDQKAVEQHLLEMKQSFQDYIPEQAAKVENAVIIRCGCYVVACVTADAEKAKDIIVKAFQ